MLALLLPLSPKFRQHHLDSAKPNADSNGVRKNMSLVACIAVITPLQIIIILKHEDVHIWTVDQTTYLTRLLCDALHVAGKGAVTMSFCTLWAPAPSFTPFI